jgi:hypothetical protein
VHGKAQRDERLPLPSDVGEAIADYLRRDRSATSSRAVFLRMLAPRQQLTPTAVTMIVYAACDRADWYLSASPELLGQAGQRLETAFEYQPGEAQ